MRSRARAAALLVAALVAASAIAHGTGGRVAGEPTLVAVGDDSVAIATGFTVAPGRVVTVAHVLDGPAVSVRGDDGVPRRATVLRRDDTLDLALLAVAGLDPAARPVAVGTWMLVRRDGEATVVPARIARPIHARLRFAGQSAVSSRPALELAAAARAGDSGAPVLRDGHVVGVLFARSHDRPDVAYAIDAAALVRVVR